MMVKGKIIWSSGKVLEFECEDAHQYLTSIFGHPTRFPDGVQVSYMEVQDATEEGKEQESDLGEHQDGDGLGETPKTGGGNSPVKSRKKQKGEEG